MVKRKRKSKRPTPARTDLAITSVTIPTQNDGAPTSPSFSMGSMVTCAEGSWYSAPSDIFERVVGFQDAFPNGEASWGEEYEEYEEYMGYGEYVEYEEYEEYKEHEEYGEYEEEYEENEEREENEHEYFWEEMCEFFHAEGDVENVLNAVADALRVDAFRLTSCTSIGSNNSGIDLFNHERFKTLPSFPLSELDEEEMETMQQHVDIPLEKLEEQEAEKTSMSLMRTISNTWTEVKMNLRSKISIRSFQSKAT